MTACIEVFKNEKFRWGNQFLYAYHYCQHCRFLHSNKIVFNNPPSLIMSIQAAIHRRVFYDHSTARSQKSNDRLRWKYIFGWGHLPELSKIA